MMRVTEEHFRTEADMLPQLATAVLNRFSMAGGQWLVIDEHLVASKIPDLLVARVNVEILRARVDLGLIRPLTATQITLLRSLRTDRAASDDLIASATRVGLETVRRNLRTLLADGYVIQPRAKVYRRATVAVPLFDRVVTIEAKLRDWRRALVQARAHRAFANETYVAFDSRYEERFLRSAQAFESSGVGLIAVESGNGTTRWITRSRPHRRTDPVSVALAGEQLLAQLQGQSLTPLPQSRLPGAAALSAHRGQHRSLGRYSRTLRRLLEALEAPPVDR
jgi:hypothetical protein